MLLAIDVGNTTISIAVVIELPSNKQNSKTLASRIHAGESFRVGKEKLNKESAHRFVDIKIVSVRQIETALFPQVLSKKLKQVLSAMTRRYDVQNVFICSVVPKVLKVLKDILQKDFKIKPVVIGEDVVVPIKNFYRNPAQVGQDRLVCSYAAKQLYGPPANHGENRRAGEPLIVIDFGTAITLDVVSKKGEYLGGIIVPGIRLTAESLFKKTAMLPKVNIQIPRELIGRDTNASILSGIFYGYGALCDGLIDLISKKMKCHPKIVMTGGYSHLMKKFISKDIYCVDPYLVFKGMNLIVLFLNPRISVNACCVTCRGN